MVLRALIFDPNPREFQSEIPAPRKEPILDAEPLDVYGKVLGIGRSVTFPYPQWRANDKYRTVFFDEGEGETLVFVHGLGGNCTHWQCILPPLRDKYRIVGLDLAGLGWSEKPDVNYTVEMLRDHLLDFLEYRKIKKATLIGHSLGGAVSTAVAFQRPELVEGLVLVCAAGVAPLPLWMQFAGKVFLNRNFLYPALLRGFNLILSNVFSDTPILNHNIRWFHASALWDSPGYPNLHDFARVSESLCKDLISQNYIAEFKKLTMPVLVLCGDEDKLTIYSKVLRRLDNIQRIRTVVLHQCGHMPMIEKAEETLFHLERFLVNPP